MEYYQRNRETQIAKTVVRNRLRKLGITEEEFFQLIERQGGRCPICNEPLSIEEKWGIAVDHDHATGRIRGILCRMCNVLLGHAKDNSTILRRAVTYLERGLTVVPVRTGR